MSKQLPAISVVIPAYNEEKLISKCITSLQNQEYPKEKYEIIVVNNRSTDKTAAIAEKLGAIVLQYHSKINTIAAVRNYGAAHAKAPLVAFIDSDSFAHPHWLSSIETMFHQDSLVAIGGIVFPAHKTLLIHAYFGIYNQFLRIMQLFGFFLPWGLNVAMRKPIFDQLGGFHEHLTSFEDADLGLRAQRMFGKRSVRYAQQVIVYTSTRKQENLGMFVKYLGDNIRNLVNVLILKKVQTAEVRYVR